jgi:hypothetical protein
MTETQEVEEGSMVAEEMTLGVLSEEEMTEAAHLEAAEEIEVDLGVADVEVDEEADQGQQR